MKSINGVYTLIGIVQKDCRTVLAEDGRTEILSEQDILALNPTDGMVVTFMANPYRDKRAAGYNFSQK